MKKLWHIDKIKELDFASPIGFMKVGDFLQSAIEEVRADYSTQYAILKKSMAESGQLVPLHISRDCSRLRDGIHRIAVSQTFTPPWNFLEVSTERRFSDWDNSEEGRKYWQLWNWRLNGMKNAI
jgi:hypothetical protein